MSGTPTLKLNDGGIATYNSSASVPSGGILEFDYTVWSGQTTSDLKITGTSLPVGASIQDLAGNTANLTLNASEANLNATDGARWPGHDGQDVHLGGALAARRAGALVAPAERHRRRQPSDKGPTRPVQALGTCPCTILSTEGEHMGTSPTCSPPRSAKPRVTASRRCNAVSVVRKIGRSSSAAGRRRAPQATDDGLGRRCPCQSLPRQT